MLFQTGGSDDETSYPRRVDPADSLVHVADEIVQAPSNMQDMMKMHAQMMAEMKAADSRLDALVKR